MLEHKLRSLCVVACLASCCAWGWAQDFAARVNEQIITTQQLTQAAGPLPSPAQDANKIQERMSAVLQGLVRQTVLAQAASEAKFHHQPEVVWAMDKAKRQVLAEAYLRKALGAPAIPTDREIDSFIAQNPHLFGDRKTYHFLRLDIPTTETFKAGAVSDLFRLNKDARSIARALGRAGIDTRVQSVWQGSEQIDPLLLKQLQTMTNGEVRRLELPKGKRWIVLQRMAAHPDPVDSAKVRGAVVRGLFDDQRQARVKEHLEQLRSSADVQFYGPDDGKAAETTPNAALVGNLPVTKAELADALSKNKLPSGDVSARQQVLQGLVDERLLQQQAQRQALDQEPQVMEAVQRAQRAVLANLYAAHLVETTTPAPAAKDVAQLVEGKPAFFTDRKVFRFTETILSMPAKDKQEIVRNTLAGMDSQRVHQWLAQSGSVIAVRSIWMAPERLTTQQYAALSQMKSGDIRVVPSSDGQTVSVIELLSSHPDPLDDEQSRTLATQILQAKAQAEHTQELVDKLVSKADIEYAPQFKPRQAVRMTTQDWGKRQWAGFLAWVAQCATLVLLLAGVSAFLIKTSKRIGFIVPLVGSEEPLRKPSRFRQMTRNHAFRLAVAAMVLGVGAATTYVQVGVVNQLIAHERMMAGGAAGALVGLLVCVALFLFDRGEQPRLKLGRWTVALAPAAAAVSGTALLWAVLAS